MDTKEDLFSLIDDLKEIVDYLYNWIEDCENISLEEWEFLSEVVTKIYMKIERVEGKIHSI